MRIIENTKGNVINSKGVISAEMLIHILFGKTFEEFESDVVIDSLKKKKPPTTANSREQRKNITSAL